ncbi:hypothetical protein J6590_079128, partial [Homalodisca vitripennis]
SYNRFAQSRYPPMLCSRRTNPALPGTTQSRPGTEQRRQLVTDGLLGKQILPEDASFYSKHVFADSFK